MKHRWLAPFVAGFGLAAVLFFLVGQKSAPTDPGEKPPAPQPVGYFEIAGPDAAKLAAFYRTVFAWEIKAGAFPDYFDIGSASPASPRGGIRQEKSAERVLYIRVPDLQLALDRVVKEGGKVLIPPTKVPGVVDFALFEDPEGNRMGVIL